MKKIMLFAAALAAVSLVSCGNKDKAADENADATEDTIVEETVVDEVDAEAMPGDPMDVVEAAAAGDLDEVLEADDEGETKEDKLQKAAKRASALVDRVKESDTYKEGKDAYKEGKAKAKEAYKEGKEKAKEALKEGSSKLKTLLNEDDE